METNCLVASLETVIGGEFASQMEPRHDIIWELGYTETRLV
jgi:hypothetical protein